MKKCTKQEMQRLLRLTTAEVKKARLHESMECQHDYVKMINKIGNRILPMSESHELYHMDWCRAAGDLLSILRFHVKVPEHEMPFDIFDYDCF